MNEKNNYQDAAMEQEFEKGYKTGKKSSAPNRAARRATQRNTKRVNSKSKRNNKTPVAGKCNPQDFAWYNQNPILTANVANLDFANPTGDLLPGYPTDDVTMYNMTLKCDPVVLPGIATLSLLPSVGVSISPSSPFNNGNRALFSYMRQARSGAAPYEPSDVGMVFTSVADAYSYGNFMIRAYAQATQYSVFNKYMPLALLKSDGLDPQDIINHRSELRYGINYYISKLAQFKIPASVTLLQRRAFLYSNIYIEGPSIKDQLYKYVPAGFSKLVDGTSENPATSIEVVPFTTTSANGFTVKDLLAFGENLLDALSNATSSSFAYIQADLLSAFGTNDSAYVKLAFMPDETTLPIQQDQNFLYQFKNATPVWQANYNDSLTDMCTNLGVTQVTNVGLSYAKSQPAVLGSTTNWGKIAQIVDEVIPEYMDVPTAQPTVEQVMEYSRLVVGVTSAIVDLKYKIYYECGTELPWQLKIWTISPATGAATPLAISRNTFDTSSDTTFVDTLMSRVFALRAFDYAPRVTFTEVGDQTATQSISAPYMVWDWDNATNLDYTSIRKLHEVALLSEFTVPGISI